MPPSPPSITLHTQIEAALAPDGPVVSGLLAAFPQALAIYAFGSQLSGTANDDSDLDLALLVAGYAEPLQLWALNVVHSFGAGLSGTLQYVRQGNVNGPTCELDDSGATAYSLGIRKELSKRTALTASYNMISNVTNNNIGASGGGQSSAVTQLGAGAQSRMIGARIQHMF